MLFGVVDDDDDVRRALTRLLRSWGHDVSLFASAEDYEEASLLADCLIVDMRLPGLNGLELHERLLLAPRRCPSSSSAATIGPTFPARAARRRS